jgi:hypothetical protein
MRAGDPLYELGMVLGGHALEDRFWARTLTALAVRVGVAEPSVTTVTTCVDRSRQWRRAGNIRSNAAVRSTASRVRGAMRRRRPDPR